jgi:hypothetical protein
MASATAGPITPTDQQIHIRATRVVFKGLGILEELLEKEPYNYDKLAAIAHVVTAGSEAMLPPDDKPPEFED